MDIIIDLLLLEKNGKVLENIELFTSEKGKNNTLASTIPTTIPLLLEKLGYPKEPFLLRIGMNEIRATTGKQSIVVLVIKTNHPLSLMTETILIGLLNEISTQYENLAKKSEFKTKLDEIIEKFGLEAFEVYQKLILTEGLYSKLPSDFILPLMERVGEGDDIINDLDQIPDRWKAKLKDAVNKVNFEARPIWELFSIPLFNPSDN